MFHTIASRVKSGVRLDLMVVDDIINNHTSLRTTRKRVRKSWIDVAPRVRYLKKKMELEPYPEDEHYKRLK